MIRNRFRLLGAIALSSSFFLAGTVTTHQASAQGLQPALRGERGSAHDIRSVERRLERMIANLKHDQRDYGGHRVKAIDLLEQADQQLQAALQVDATTPH